MHPSTTGLHRTFPLSADNLAANSAVSLDLGGSTDADVALAIVGGDPFPTRPDGEIGLAHIGLTVSGGNPIAFDGGGTTVGFEFSAGVTAAAAIFDDPQKALAALELGETPGLDLTISSIPNARYALLRTGYKASGSVTGTHPIGALGSFTFGASGATSGMSAVIHRFADDTSARSVLETTVKSWQLPRHVDADSKLAPATWVIAEADGSLAVKLAASLGYNFNFVREARLAGLSGDIGLKIDAAATATFGFDVSGRYLVAVARETDARELRLLMFKLSRRGLQAGLNVKIGVTGVETIAPDSVDDFVAAVFGVHGAQIAGALKHIDEWTDPTQSVGELVAGLGNAKALDLLRTLTDVDPATAFDAARQRLVDALNLYESLPPRVSSELWGVLDGLDEGHTLLLKNTLQLLASNDEAVQKQALHDILGATGFANKPAGRIISALGDRGLLTLLDRLPALRAATRTILSVLDGGVIGRLHAFIGDKLNLQKVLGAINENDFNSLDSFLVGRLAAFFDKELHFVDLQEIKNAINVVVGKRVEVYDKVRKALNSRYGLELSSTWQKTTARTAVLDVVFDTSKGEGRQILAKVLQHGDVDALMLTDSSAVHINGAVLTHELTRRTTVDLSLPHFSFHGESFNTAIAKATAEDEGGRVLLYDATGTDVVAVRRKFQSSLSVSITAAVSGTNKARFKDLRVHSTDAATWSYQLLHAKSRMRREELEAYTRPFISQYMADQFTGGTSVSTWYNELDRTVENVLGNGPEEFGDVCARFEVTMPGETLGAWLVPQANITSAAKVVAKAIQKALKAVVPFYYLTDITRLHDLTSSAAVLGWAAIRPTNDIRVDGDQITFDIGKRVFWDHVEPENRQAMLNNAITKQNVLAMLPPLRLRLEEAGMHSDVQFYRDNQVSTILGVAAGGGDVFVKGLLTFEAMIVEKAAEALVDIQNFLGVANSSPSKAIERLADFAADITTAFNKLITNSIFGGVSFRAVSQTVFADASRALDPGLLAAPRAMLALSVLRPAAQRTFELPSFLTGAIPRAEDVAVEEHLVSA